MVLSPWKILAGIFAAFPAVMLTAILMVGLAAGSKNAANVAKGSVFGMIGGVVCVITVLLSLQFTQNWILSIVLGLVFWLGSSIAVSSLKDALINKSHTPYFLKRIFSASKK